MKATPISLGILALIATAALWGSNHVVARAARDAIPLPALVFWRWFLAAIVLTFVALPVLHQAWPAIRLQLGGLIVGGAVGVGLFSYLLLGGAYQSLAIEVALINATTPVWVLLFGLQMDGGQLTAKIKLGLVLAFAGTLLIISKGRLQDLTAFRFSLGNLWSLFAATSFAWFSIRIRDWTLTIAPLALTVVTAWSGLIVVMLPVYLIWLVCGEPWLVWSAADTGFALATIAYIGFAPTMLGNLFYLYGVGLLGPARAAAFLYLSPLFTAAFSMGWLGEEPAWYHLVGIAAVFAGLTVMSGRLQPSHRPDRYSINLNGQKTDPRVSDIGCRLLKAKRRSSLCRLAPP
jgi:drug/metabolite transporter (DMT)-like permease